MNGNEYTLSKSAANVMAQYFQLSALEQRKVADLIFSANRGFNGFNGGGSSHLPLFVPAFPPSPVAVAAVGGEVVSPSNNNVWSAAPKEVIEQIKQPPPPASQPQEAEVPRPFVKACDNDKCRCRYYLNKEEEENEVPVPALNDLGVVVFDVEHPAEAEDMSDKELSRWVYSRVADALNTKATHIRVDRLWVRANRRVVDVYFKSHHDAVRGLWRFRKQGFAVNWMRQRAPKEEEQYDN